MSVNLNDPVRQYLSSVAEAKIEARRLRFKLKRLETQATRITTAITGMPGGGTADRERLLAELADLSEQSRLALIEAEKQENEVSAFISRLQDQTSRIILKLRYCDCLVWDTTDLKRRSVKSEMAKVGLCYENTQLFRLHGKALNEARELYYKENNHDKKRNP
jgi:hypothetical protein